MKSLRSFIRVWYWERLEYMRWMMAVTLPKTTACIRAAGSRCKAASWLLFLSFFFFFDDFDFFFLMRWDVLKLTAHQHHADGEDFFCVRIGTHVAKPDAGEAAEGEVEGGDVGAGYRGATHGAVDVRRLQTLSQLLKPSCRVRSNGSCVRVMLAYKVTAKCSLLWVFFAIVWVSSDNRPFPFGWWYDGNITGNYIIHCWWYNGNCLWVILGDDALVLLHLPMSQVTGSLLSISARPMTYQTQAIQWARRANADMSSVRTTALYWE